MRMGLVERIIDFGHKLSHHLGEKTEFGENLKSPSLAAQQEYLDHHPFSSLIPYQAFNPATNLFYNHGSVGFVIETTPLVGCTEAMQREISSIFVNLLPEGSSLQVMLFADHRIEPILDYWAHVRAEHGERLAGIAKARVDYFNSLVFKKDAPATLRNYRCIFSYSEPNWPDTEPEVNRLLMLKQQLTTTIEALGVRAKIWEARDLIRTLDGIINFKAEALSSTQTWNPYESLNKQISTADTSYHVKPKHIILRDHEAAIRSYKAVNGPDKWSMSAMAELVGDTFRDQLQIPCPFILHYGIHVPHQESSDAKVMNKEAWVESQAKSKIGKHIPTLVKQAAELNFVRHQIQQGERYVQTNLTVTLLVPHAQLVEADQMLCNLFRSKRWQLIPFSVIQLHNFLAILPMAWSSGMVADTGYFGQLKTTITTEPANLLPLQGEWQGTRSPGMLLTGRKGQVLTWSPFDNEHGNYNVAVVGRSGAGKSVFMQELMTSVLGQGGRVFILDVGRSFEKTAKLLSGEYVEFSTYSDVCINPFSNLPADDPNQVSDALAMLKPIVSLMAAPRDNTSDHEYSLIEMALRASWDKYGREAGIQEVADELLTMNQLEAKQLGDMLFPYTRKGSYGRFFNGKANVNLSSPLVLIELEELKERKDLQSVVVQMVILQITNQLYLGDRQTPSALILDEAWDMLRGKQSGEFIETAARRLRKYRGSLIVGTQSINDFYRTPGAQAAFDNSDWLCLLSQKAESIAQLKKTERIVMDPMMENLLSSVRTVSGKYAEIMIYGPHGYAVCRLILDPFSNVLYSTKPEEFAAVQTLTKQGLTLMEAINVVAQKRK